MDDKPLTKRDEPSTHDVIDKPPLVRIEDLSHLIRTKRWNEGLTLEQAAKDIGVSAATLSRWERGGRHGKTSHPGERSAIGRGPMEPDVRTLTALARWLRVSFDSVLESDPASRHLVSDNGHDMSDNALSTPEMVEAHLRADRNLKPDTAAALARVFQVAYEQFTKFGSSDLEDDDGAG